MNGKVSKVLKVSELSRRSGGLMTKAKAQMKNECQRRKKGLEALALMFWYFN